MEPDTNTGQRGHASMMVRGGYWMAAMPGMKPDGSLNANMLLSDTNGAATRK